MENNGKKAEPLSDLTLEKVTGGTDKKEYLDKAYDCCPVCGDSGGDAWTLEEYVNGIRCYRNRCDCGTVYYIRL